MLMHGFSFYDYSILKFDSSHLNQISKCCNELQDELQDLAQIFIKLVFFTLLSVLTYDINVKVPDLK